MRTLFAGLLVLLILTAVPLTSIAEDLPFIVHGNLGFGKMLEDNAPGGSVGLGVGVIYPIADMPIAIGGDLGFLLLGKESESYTDPFTGATATAETKISAIPITGQAYLWFPAGEQATVYGDAGMGLYHMRWSASAKASYGGNTVSTSASDSETDFGINGGGGFKFSPADFPISFGADGKIHIVLTDVESTTVLTLMARVYFP